MTIGLTERYAEREFSYVETSYEGRRVTQPSLGFVVARAGLGCVVATAECFGKSTSWSDNGSERSGRTATGGVRHKERTNSMSVDLSIEWAGYDKAGALIATRQGSVRATGSAAIPLRSFVLALSRQPEKIEVKLMTLSVDGKPSAARVASPPAIVGPAQIAGLNIKLESWLSVEERMATHSKELRERLLAQDWNGANRAFAKLEAGEAALPASFPYRYGENLIRSGNTVKGKEYLRKYLAQSGAEGEFNDRAQALLDK